MSREEMLPPRLLERCLLVFVSCEERSAIREDLRELFRRRVESKGERAAILWYGRQSLSFALRFRPPRPWSIFPMSGSAPLAGSFARDTAYAI